MGRRARSILAAASLLIAGVAAAPGAGARPDDRDADALSVWHAEVAQEQVPLLLEAGADAHELTERVPAKGTATVELFLTGAQAGRLRGEGVDLAEHALSDRAEKGRRRRRRRLPPVRRPRRPQAGDPGHRPDPPRPHQGRLDRQDPQGQDILALKISKGAGRSKDGSKPATLYMSNQHAREWITPR